MTNILLATLALGGLGLDITRQVLHAVGECRPDWSAELVLLTHRQAHDRLPVADGLDEIRRRTR